MAEPRRAVDTSAQNVAFTKADASELLAGRPLARWQARAIWARDALHSAFRFAMHRVNRDASLVDAEYNNGSWNQLLRAQTWARHDRLQDYLVHDDGTFRIARIGNGLVEVSGAEYYRFRIAMLHQILAEYSDPEDEELVEFGCGCGMNVLSLMLSRRWRLVRGYDVSKIGLEVASRTAQHFGVSDRCSFASLDLTQSASALGKARGKTAFTYYCLEQLKYSTATALETLLASGAKRVVHIEPTIELLNLRTLRDLADRLYIASQDYQDNLLRTIQDFERRGVVRITAVRRLNFAPTPRHDPTLICWEPIAHRGHSGHE